MNSTEDLVKHWLRLDRDKDTRREIEGLWEQRNLTELNSRLSTRLAFGTAGLRARMGAGFSRINSLTIIQTSQGLAEYLLQSEDGADFKGVVIGYDARHNSKKFAGLAAAAFVAKGFRVWWYEDRPRSTSLPNAIFQNKLCPKEWALTPKFVVVHTPMVPFAVKQLRAAAGVMITASHNPAEDNGYKVYGSNGCQINSPADAKIAVSIMNNLDPIVWAIESSEMLKPLSASMRVSYLQTVSRLVSTSSISAIPPAFVYTAMHGVGFEPMQAALRTMGYHDKMVVVEEQAQPNPDFPTVTYPNPEEQGALDLAKATANRESICLVLANDPDADRFAAAERVEDASWHQFTGDEMGILLAHYLLELKKHDVNSDRDYMLTSAVSSQFLSVLGEATGFAVEETLTGFKWLGKRALELENQGRKVHLAYEEALGYMFPDIVYDKDGIAAAIVFLRACASWGSPFAKLQDLYAQYGYFRTSNTYWRSPNQETTEAVFESIRRLGTPFPPHVGERRVARWRDLTIGYDSSTEDHAPNLPLSKGGEMITCWLERDTSNETPDDTTIRFTVRTSGTEPKIKIYLESRSSDSNSARKSAVQTLELVSREWFADPRLVMEKINYS